MTQSLYNHINAQAKDGEAQAQHPFTPATATIEERTVPVPASILATNPDRYQARLGLLRQELRMFLADAVESSHSADGLARLGPAAGAALDALLATHSVDRRGRCWSCRRRGWLGRRRPVCLVYVQAQYWLHLPARLVQARLASELGSGAIAEQPRLKSDRRERSSDHSLRTAAVPPLPDQPTGASGRSDPHFPAEVGVMSAGHRR